MSWSLTRSSVAYLSGVLSWQPTGVTAVIWHKTTIGSDYHRLLYLYGDNDSDYLQMFITPGGSNINSANLSNASLGQSTFCASDTAPSETWCVEIYRFNDSTVKAQLFSTGGDSDEATDTGFTWIPRPMTSILIGANLAVDNTHDGLIGLVALYDGALSDGDIASLKAGAHPQAIGSVAHLWDWTHGRNSLAAIVGGVTLTGHGTNAYSADDPDIDAPPGGGGGGVTLVQVERGRVLARGLMRGVA